jgi:hypothetical protein
VITNIVEQVRVYGPPTQIQPPQVPLVSAEDAAELVVQGILDDRLLVVTDAVVQEMVEQHAHDRDAFLRSQIAYLEEDP